MGIGPISLLTTSNTIVQMMSKVNQVVTTVQAQAAANTTAIGALGALTPSIDQIPIFSSTSAATTITAKPSGKALLQIAGTSAAWQVPYLTSNTATGAAVSAARPAGLAIVGLASTIDQIPIFTSNSAASTITAKPSGKALLQLAGTAAKWQVPYLTSNTATTAAVAAITPAGLASLSVANPVGKWNIDYFTSNTATSASLAPITPAGLASLAIANPAGKWNIDYFTSNTSTSASVSPIAPGGLALISLVGAANKIPAFTGNTATSVTTVTYGTTNAASSLVQLDGGGRLGAVDGRNLIHAGVPKAVTLTDGVTISWDASLGNVATVTLGGNRTLAAPTNLDVGTYILHVVQDATGSRTLTWNGVFKWTAQTAPTLSTAANARDVFSFVSDGIKMYGSFMPDVR